MSLNDQAWEILFDRYNILEHINEVGFYEIEAKTIREVREPRLMAKFDHRSNLPLIFRKNGMSILPVSRSKYVVGKFDAYQKVTYDEHLKPIEVSLPSQIETMDGANLYSESAALHCAYISGMIEDVVGERVLPTVSGRMSSQQFDFQIRSTRDKYYNLSIKNAQVEIDAGYEGMNNFALVEAKKESVEDFLVRQLYYPYRLWQGKVSKKVMPIFFTHSADMFSFFKYKFTDLSSYNSLQLVEQKNYVLSHEKILMKEVVDLLQKAKRVDEPEIPFPQADSFIRMIDLLGLLMEKDLDKEIITSAYNFDERQTQYYTTGGMYLGLIEKHTDRTMPHLSIKYALTEKGKRIMNLPYKRKYLALAECILEHGVFQSTLKRYLEKRQTPTRQEIVKIMKDAGLYGIRQDSTFNRRASTVMRWVEWIINLPKQ